MARSKTPTMITGSSRPFITPEGQENHLVSLAYTLVEQRLRDGTASSQETTHFLKIGSSNAQLERERLINENRLLQAKTDNLESQKNQAAMYEDALNAMRRYSGQEVEYYDD